MIYKSKLGDLDLSKVTRLYPAAVVDMHGEVAEMSLEWIEMSGDKVKIKGFVLVFDFPPLTEDVRNKVVLEFETKDELIGVMTEVAQLFQNRAK
ncbi:hypothetical protein SAMN06314042_10716 [Epsilonproteobacteria bacterium SCGC AD-308-O04]|jgi:hypothetical protein|nr:hypothetical protein SAMN06314042_10716 [Epsilonproteobacteria bacterium SCGC AD-308-O04]